MCWKNSDQFSDEALLGEHVDLDLDAVRQFPDEISETRDVLASPAGDGDAVDVWRP